MSLQKHEREAIRVAEALNPGIKAHVETRRRNPHPVLVATMGTTTVRYALSCSPRDDSQHAQWVRQRITSLFREQGITL